ERIVELGLVPEGEKVFGQIDGQLVGEPQVRREFRVLNAHPRINGVEAWQGPLIAHGQPPHSGGPVVRRGGVATVADARPQPEAGYVHDSEGSPVGGTAEGNGAAAGEPFRSVGEVVRWLRSGAVG